MALSRAIYIVGAKRTAFGAFGGKLSKHSATDMQEIAGRAALAQSGVDPSAVDTVVIGNVIQSSKDAAYIARHVGLRLGCPVETPALTVNRLCGSGFQAIASGAQDIVMGDAEVALVGGSESMTQCPFVLRDARFGTRLGTDLNLEDTLWTGLTDQHIKTPMAITAENLAEKFGLSREDCDEFALRSQQRWSAAQKEGRFAAEIEGITLKGRKGEELFSVDEHAKPATTKEILAKLPTVFKKNGTVTAGTASGICDGAAALVLASEEAVSRLKLKPLARLVGYSCVGCDPSIMGIGPVLAIQKLLAKTSTSLSQIDLFEVNEAFAAQALSVIKAAELDPEKTNVNGGAIALGHPLAASGARITAHLVYELQRTGGKLAIGSACIGGGQGMAVLLERC